MYLGRRGWTDGGGGTDWPGRDRAAGRRLLGVVVQAGVPRQRRFSSAQRTVGTCCPPHVQIEDAARAGRPEGAERLARLGVTSREKLRERRAQARAPHASGGQTGGGQPPSCHTQQSRGRDEEGR